MMGILIAITFFILGKEWDKIKEFVGETIKEVEDEIKD